MAASVLTVPQYDIVYPPTDGLTTVPTLVTTAIAAYQDSTNAKQSLTVGASSNILAQAVNSIYLEHGATDKLSLQAASGSNLTEYMTVGLSNARVTLADKQLAGLTFQTMDTYLGSAHFVEDASKMTLSMPSLTEGLLVAPPVAMQSTLAVALDTSLNQNLFVTGDTGMGGRLVTYGGIFTPDIAVYKNSSNAGAAQVGYSWKINSSDQLELVKYTFFGQSTTAVTKKVAVFGSQHLTSGDSSDVTYAASLITSSAGNSGSNAGGAPGFSSATTAFTVTANGSMYTTNTLAIGTSNINSNVALQVNGTVESTSVIATSSVASPSFLTTSDERLKNVLGSIDGQDALSAIMNLSPLTYAWKSDADQSPHAGFTAQNIDASLPLAVQMAGNDADVMHIDNTALLAYLVAAVKELGARV